MIKGPGICTVFFSHIFFFPLSFQTGLKRHCQNQQIYAYMTHQGPTNSWEQSHKGEQPVTNSNALAVL